MAKMQLPAGFEPISGGGKFAPSWDFKRQKIVQGIVTRFGSATVNKGKKDERTVKVATIKQKGGAEVSVFESGGNKGLFAVKKGAEVFIQYIGKKKLPGRKQPMNDFIVGARSAAGGKRGK